VGDVVFPVVNKSDQVTAEVARGFAAEIEKAVLGDKEQDLKDRIGRNASPPSSSEDRRERARRWKKETRALRKAITPQAYRALCTEANRTRRKHDGKEVKMTWKAKECQKPGRSGDEGMQEQQPIRTNHIDRPQGEEDTGGWIASEELLRQLRDVVGWKEPPVLLAKRNMDLMPRLRSLEQALVLIPWQDGASQIIEVIDRLVEIPLLVPSSYMIRAHGKPLKDKPWLLAQIDTPKKAET